ncbi:DUF6159 family protein [bacterium]|nr:DUF6159 family protein [bacterium]
MNKLQRSWALFKCSLGVVMTNRKLLVFPILTLSLCLVIILFFVAPLALWSTGHGLLETKHWEIVGSHFLTWSEKWGHDTDFRFRPLGYFVAAVLYVVALFLATFCNVAFFNEILRAFNGQPVSIRGGLRFAMSRLRAILAWTLLSGIVGLLIQMLERRVGIIGRLIVRLIGIAWSVAAVFTIPVIVREEKNNPVHMLKTSAFLLKKTWGESLAGYVGIQLSGMLVCYSLILGGLLMFFATVVVKSLMVFLVIWSVWIIVFIIIAFLTSVLNQVYCCALYIYATEGVVPGPFDEEQMNMAWKVQSGRSAK